MLILLAMSYGEKIREVRKRELLTQEVFAERIGVSRSVLSQIEIGRINPTAETLRNIARQFGVSLDYLVMDEAPLAEDREYPELEEPEAGQVDEELDENSLPNSNGLFHYLSLPPRGSWYRGMKEIPFVTRREWHQLEVLAVHRIITDLTISLPVPPRENIFAVELPVESPVSWLNCPIALIQPMEPNAIKIGDSIFFLRRGNPVFGEVQYVDARGWVMNGTMYMNREIVVIWRLLDVIGLQKG